MVEAPGTAPGSEWLITTAFIAIAGRIRHPEYNDHFDQKKGFLRGARIKVCCERLKRALLRAAKRHEAGETSA